MLLKWNVLGDNSYGMFVLLLLLQVSLLLQRLLSIHFVFQFDLFFCIPGSSAVTTSSSPTSYKSTGNVNKRFPFGKNDLNQRLHCEEVFARRNHQFALSNYEPVGEKNLFSSLMVFPPRNQFAISYDKSGER